MGRKIDLTPLPLACLPDGWRRACRVVLNDREAESPSDLWWEYATKAPPPSPDDCDSYVLATLLPAMKRGANIRVHGSVSRGLLANLEELQHVWARWCPDLYSRISIEVETVREHERAVEGAVAAFSGGVDAQFTAYRHAKGLAGYAGQSLRAGVFVHGFDIPLDDQDGFSRAAAKAKVVLADIGLDLTLVRTNIREFWGDNWAHYSGTALASVLNGLKVLAGVGLVGSGEPYDALVVPWGSHPIPDALSGSGDFKIIHDGAGFNRSEKFKVLSSWAMGVRHLRVCWVGDDHGRNCGKCEKCMRTRLNLLLAGFAQSDCFDTPLDRQDLASVALSSEPARAEWKLIRDEMARTGLGAELLPDVEKVLKRPATRWTRLLPVGSCRRALVKRMLGKSA